MARPSALYRSTNSRSKYKFPILDVKELVNLYRTMQFDITESDILKPTSAFMHVLIDQIIDKFLYISPNEIRRKVDTLIKSDDGLKPALNKVIRHKIMYKFLCDCGVDDFSLKDASKPESSRLRIILSSLVNYARFREQRMTDCDELLGKNDELLLEYKSLINNNNELKLQINDLNERISNEGVNLNEINKENKDLESKLIKLKNTQEEITANHESYKNKKSILVKELENQSALYIEAEKELEQIRPYIKESPESIKELIDKMRDSKIREEKVLADLDKKSRDISVSIQSFQLLIQDFTNLSKLLEELFEDATKNNIYGEKLKTIKNQINEAQDEVNDYSRRITQLEHQLKHNEDRLVKLQNFYKDKIEIIDKKLEDQLLEYNKLKAKRNEEEVAIVEKEVQISNLESQLADLDKSWEAECKDATFMLDKLKSQVNIYVTEMVKKIDEANKSLQ